MRVSRHVRGSPRDGGTAPGCARRPSEWGARPNHAIGDSSRRVGGSTRLGLADFLAARLRLPRTPHPDPSLSRRLRSPRGYPRRSVAPRVMCVMRALRETALVFAELPRMAVLALSQLAAAHAGLSRLGHRGDRVESRGRRGIGCGGLGSVAGGVSVEQGSGGHLGLLHQSSLSGEPINPTTVPRANFSETSDVPRKAVPPPEENLERRRAGGWGG